MKTSMHSLGTGVPQRTAPARPAPAIDAALVELERAVPRCRGHFLEPSALSGQQAQQFLQQALPHAPSELRHAAFDRMVRALAEKRHNLVHAGAMLHFVAAHMADRLATLAAQLAAPADAGTLQRWGHTLRQLEGLAPSPEVAERLRAVRGQAEQRLAQLPRPPPSLVPTHPFDALRRSLGLDPMIKLRIADRGTTAAPMQRFAFVSSEGAQPLRGLMGASEERRGRLSKIKPLLLEDDPGQWVDKVVHIEGAGRATDESMPAATYQRQAQAARLAQSKLLPRGCYYDAKGQLHDVVPRYDGDVVHLVASHAPEPLPFGCTLAIAEEVLTRLANLAAHGWAHLDVKPDNVLWRRDGSYALTDYDTARPTAEMDAGALVGSQGFTAPELLLGRQAATPAADLFSLGVTLGTLLAPQELRHVGIVLQADHATFRDADAQYRDMVDELVLQETRAYVAYQARRSAAADDAGTRHAPGAKDAEAAEVGASYDALRHALTRRSDAWFAALVVDHLLHAQPEARGSAGAWRQALRQRYPDGHPGRRGSTEALRRGSVACSYTQRMDATYAAMASYRDGLVRLAPVAVAPAVAGAHAPKPGA